jgi:dynein heavy chain
VEDLQKIIVMSGMEKKKTLFLISDFQIKNAYILENLNSLINLGEVPNLFKTEDMLAIMDQLRMNYRKDNRSDNSETLSQ